jgi:pyruvate ferredoxin oxidoreductase gamma subunit
MLLKIRFHGRGGHGMKTAARTVGTAAFLAGYQAQDAPMYGAERRGAAVSAFVRISDEPILERGPIEAPNLIALADETLLRDASSDVLRGQQEAAAIFINAQEARPLSATFDIQPPLISFDVSGLTREVLGRASALSAGFSAAVARLSGLIQLDQLQRAMQQELEEIGVAPAEIEKNFSIGEQIFNALSPLPRPIQIIPTSPIQEALVVPTYHHPLVATPSILHAGNAILRNTGSWRVERPVVDWAACTRCGLCYVMCPDGAIQLDEQGYPVIDYDHCKGCMICQRLCPLAAIGCQQETRAW